MKKKSSKEIRLVASNESEAVEKNSAESESQKESRVEQIRQEFNARTREVAIDEKARMTIPRPHRDFLYDGAGLAVYVFDDNTENGFGSRILVFTTFDRIAEDSKIEVNFSNYAADEARVKNTRVCFGAGNLKKIGWDAAEIAKVNRGLPEAEKLKATLHFNKGKGVFYLYPDSFQPVGSLKEFEESMKKEE